MSEPDLNCKTNIANDLKLKYLKLLSGKLSSFRKNGKYCDAKLKVGEKVFKCHRNIIDANSKYFTVLFKDNFKDGNEEVKSLPSEYVDEKSFAKLLDAMYGEPFEINDDLVPIFTTSLYLQLTYFVDLCKEYIRNNLNTINTVELIILPQLKFDESLYTLVMKHVCKNFSKLHSHLIGISVEVFEDLMLDPELHILNKDQVLEFGANWIFFDVQNRKKYLQKVSSLLKPFHTPSKQSVKLVSEMDALILLNVYHVKVALNTLLELSDEPNDRDENKPDMSYPLFFVQPNNDSEVMFGTYRDNAWVFLHEFHLPKVPLMKEHSYESAVAKNMIYLLTESDNPNIPQEQKVMYYNYNKENEEWVRLMPPRSMPRCLATCNGMVYSYEDLKTDFQISVFEPFLNRWMHVPAVTYPRSCAGITADDHVLYMVGGLPLKQIATESPTNIVEMYDSRCGYWSRIKLPSTHEIPHKDYSKKVFFMDKTLYMITNEGSFAGVDTRNNNWVIIPKAVTTTPVNYLTSVDKKLWVIHENPSHGIFALDSKGTKVLTLPNPNVFVKPILSLSLI